MLPCNACGYSIEVSLRKHICNDMEYPIIAFVSSDNNYGGSDPEYTQTPLAEVTPEITAAAKKMKNQDNS